jgi:outer membrane protein assembly factor BamB
MASIMKQQRQSVRVIQILVALALVLTLLLVLVLAFSPQAKTLNGTPPPVPGDDWPMYLHDPQRTADSGPGESVISPSNAGQLTRLWSFQTGAGIAASSSIVGGTVYIGSWDGFEYALDALKGFQKWRTYLGITTARCVPPVTGITSGAAVVDHVVYVGGGDSYWYALDAYTGAVLWKVFTGDNSANSGYYNWSSPLIYNGYAYIGIASDCDNPLTQGKLLKVDLTSHQVVGSFKVVQDGEVGGGIWTSPSLDAATNTIFLTTGTQDTITQTLSQAIIAIDATTMAMKGAWQIPLMQAGTDSDWGSTPILFTDANGRKLVAATNKNGFTYAFDQARISAGPIWERQISFAGICPVCGEGSVSSGAFGNGTLYMAGGHTTINGVGYPGSVRAIDPATGKYLWEHGVPDPIVPALVYTNGLIIDGAGPTMEVLDARTGTRLYSYDIGGDQRYNGDGIYGAPSVSHGEIFIGALDGNVYAFGPGASQIPPSDPHCPRGWACQDIGNPRVPGSETFTGSAGSISGFDLGVADISDQFRFINQHVSGDTQIRAQVRLPATNASAQAGLMVRQRTDTGSPFYAAFLTSKGGLIVEYRNQFNGAINVTGLLGTVARPRYLEIQRVGDQFRAAVSADGTTYTLVPGGTVALLMPAGVLEGLAVSSGASGSLATATYTGVAIGAPIEVPAEPGPTTPCPGGWGCGDVGNPELVGNQSLDNGTWTLQGAGKDIWGTSDQFHFIWQSIAEDGSVSAQVLDPGQGVPSTKTGVMLRAGTDANAPYYAAILTDHGTLTVQYRATPGLNAVIFTTSTIAGPIYLRVARWKNIFTTYTSTDGVAWTPLDGSSIEIAISGPMQAGLAVSSLRPETLSAVTFGSVSTADTADPAPTACPSGWTCADVGYPAPQGSQLYNRGTGTWTLQGGGFDIFFNRDQFHYVWRTLKGDGVVSAQVVDQGYTSPSAKAGVMLRASTDTSSPFYAVFVTPKNDLLVHFRLKAGGMIQEIKLPPQTPKLPIYLKVTRRGNVFTAYTSQDGFAWTPIAGSSIAMNTGSTMLAGLAVTSHNPSYLSVVTFDSVVIG